MPEFDVEALTGLVHENIESCNYRLARAWLNVLIEINDHLAGTPVAPVPKYCEHGYPTATDYATGQRYHVPTRGICNSSSVQSRQGPKLLK